MEFEVKLTEAINKLAYDDVEFSIDQGHYVMTYKSALSFHLFNGSIVITDKSGYALNYTPASTVHDAIRPKIDLLLKEHKDRQNALVEREILNVFSKE